MPSLIPILQPTGSSRQSRGSRTSPLPPPSPLVMLPQWFFREGAGGDTLHRGCDKPSWPDKQEEVKMKLALTAMVLLATLELQWPKHRRRRHHRRKG